MIVGKKQHVLAILFIVVLGVSIYANTLGNSFVMDDRYVVKDNSFISSGNNLRYLFDPSVYFAGSSERTYRPVVTLSYFADYALWEYNPFGYHLTNLVLHILNGILFYFMLLSFMSFSGDKRMNLEVVQPYYGFLPAAAALFFVSHPIQTEAVNFVGTRHDLLMTFFYFMAIAGYLNARASRGIAAILIYILSLVSYLFSCLSKEMGITLPAVIMLMDTFAPGDPGEKTLAKRAKWYAGYFLVAGLFVYIRFFKMIYPGELGAVSRQILIKHFFPAAGILIRYLGLFLFPLRLSAEYVAGPGYVEKVPGSITEPVVYGSTIALVVLLSLIIRFRRRYPMICFGGAWFFITTLPLLYIFISVSGFPMREKYLYLPSAGFYIFLAFALYRVICLRAGPARSMIIRRGVVVFAGVLLCLYSVRTFTRNMDWRDGVTLWTSTLKTSPESYRAYYNLGMSYQYDRQETEKAIASFERSLQCADLAMTRDMLGFLYFQKGQYDEALAELKRANQMRPDLGSVYYHLGLLYLAKGEYDEVISLQKTALRRSGRSFETHYEPMPFADIHNVLGQAYYQKGEYDRAIEQFNTVLELNPDYPEVYFFLGSAYLKQGLYDRAIEVYTKALKRFPADNNTRYLLAKAYLRKKLFDKAQREYLVILRLDPSHVDARNNLANIYFSQGLSGKAIEEYRKVLEISPSHSNARNNLANIYLSKRMYDEAIGGYKYVLGTDPQNPVVHYNLGLAYDGKGMTGEAKREWEMAVFIDPEFLPARRALEGLRRSEKK